jgi:5-methylcytosine-specific restriction endonuclease McrA
MAGVWLPRKSKYWVACWRDSNGRQRRCSTRETNKYKAKLIADAFERVTRERRSKLYVQRVIARLHEDLGGGPLSTNEVSEIQQRQGYDERFSKRLLLLEEELAQRSNGDRLPKRFWEIVRGMGCTNCGFNKWSQILQFHHIDKDRKNNSLQNLMILCPNCHRAVHHRVPEIRLKSLAQLLVEYGVREH